MSLILDLSTHDYQEVYADQSHLWQTQAYEDLCKHLCHIGLQAKSYAEDFRSDSVTAKHAHDTIFVSGGRGSGKTVFLKNIDGYWSRFQKIGKPNIVFTPIIDPTLLVDHDNFSNVIVASLYNIVESKLNLGEISEGKKNVFFCTLKKLAGSLGNRADYEDRYGLDLLIKYTSGIQVEKLFHEFVISCIDILGVDAIVITIDDVDMALGRAYEVLEVVRKMLLCPLIIPIVSGDESLYQHMVKLQFLNNTLPSEYRSNNQQDVNNIRVNGFALSDSLKDAYLTKVFPQQYRITLEAIDRLKNRVVIVEGSNDHIGLPYISEAGNDSYITRFYSMFFGLVNREERSADFPDVANARELTQLVRSLSPSNLVDSKNLSLANFEILRAWAQSKAHGATYTYAVAAKDILDAIRPLPLSSLLPFNPKAQAALNIPWACKDFLNEQRSYLEKSTTPSKSTHGVNTNEFLLEDSLSGNILRSMPPLEMHMMSMIVPYKVMKDDGLDGTELSFIYTYKDYYGLQGNQAHKVFCSRAFELLGTSLLMVTNTKELTISSFEVQLRDLFSRAPFYSIHAMNPTKYIRDVSEELDETDVTGLMAEVTDEEIIRQLSLKLYDWAEVYHLGLSGFSSVSLIPLLSAVFNKVFSQLNVVRVEKKNFENEHLTDFIKRFEFITVNAFATFLKEGMVYKANIAMTKSSERFRDLNDFISYEHVFTRNVKDFIDLKTKKAVDTESEKEKFRSTLLEAIWNHPIFTLLDEGAVMIPSGLLSGTSKSSTKEKPSSSKEVGTKGFSKKIYEPLFEEYRIKPKLSELVRLVEYMLKVSDDKSLKFISKILKNDLLVRNISVSELSVNAKKVCDYLGIKG